ncbi:hypothetical protein [Massilia yuzhufengensis]|uniref:Regulatory protein, RpfE type n=1 Tax=Massilia yuzhufengensis TaxID=1164594 RepID=A0A1I1U6H2_9BURK|nr:hypothetical protein [Massilia yuzhufengensis]SFD66466.1 hypothetical protein SAMN05216204_13223 [Massilia yuzhufengensis]
MSQITLVLPYLLPLPEFAPDLVRALQTPMLASLLARSTAHERGSAPDTSLALPHEQWLARALGLSPEGRPAFAAAAMRGFGLEPAGGTWFIVSPAHIQIARSHSMMTDARHLGLLEEESRALYDAARGLCEEIGRPLLYGDAGTWFLRADDWAGIGIATPDTVAGMDLTDFVPRGAAALAYRRLQNEVQMAWYTHPVNTAREARRLPVVNAFWLWGAASDPGPAAGNLASTGVPGWLRALSNRHLDSPGALDGALAQDGMLVVGSLADAALAADWHAWLQGVQQLEEKLFAPLHAALVQGRIRKLRLVLSSREAIAEFTTTAMAQRAFWRRPTLERLT